MSSVPVGSLVALTVLSWQPGLVEVPCQPMSLIQVQNTAGSSHAGPRQCVPQFKISES